MLMTTALATTLLLLLQCSEICVAIKVPVVWNEGDSEVKNNGFNDEEFSVDVFKPNVLKQEPVPVEYFQYPAKKPQFAVDIASFHGIPSPASHYKAYPVRPYTGQDKPNLGKHRIQDPNKDIFSPLQKYTKNKDNYNSQITPIVSHYDVYHPYKEEEPSLKELYKDPVLDKIRNDLRDTSKRLQNYEKEAGKPQIESDEYLETPEETDRKKLPQRNIPVKYEVHRPQRYPIYYRPLQKYSNRDQILNHRFRHPWNQNFVKIRPVHYQPLKHHLQKLRQHHALTYDDEQNEYPQVAVADAIEQPSDGYDIYEKGRQKYVQLRNNLDESINQAVRKNRPLVSQKLELQSNEEPAIDEEDDFVPIKSYAQVRKTETTKHLPKAAAFEDADTYEEIRNAPRLKEAVKITKGQTVYTEEGYEDSAYDHAGEQKHASDHEEHGGFLKENEISGGKYKIPSINTNHDDENGFAYRNQLLHGEKWSNNNKDHEKELESEQYAENEQDQSVESDTYKDIPETEGNDQRNKREKKSTNESDSNTNITEHDVDKREVSFKVPDIDLNSTLLTEGEILEIAKEKILNKDDLREKYPYYFNNITFIHKDSPLRYAENLKLIPKKSNGGTEFYDSRSLIVCPEVDKKVDAIPKKLKKKGHPDSEDESDNLNNKNEKEEVDIVEEQPRLSGLGDKIDCFKAKYFGENPLDSPFFKEDIISNPEPITTSDLSTFKLTKDSDMQKSKAKIKNYDDIFDLISKMRINKNDAIVAFEKGKRDILQSLYSPSNISSNSSELSLSQTHMENVEKSKNTTTSNPLIIKTNGSNLFDENLNQTIVYKAFRNKEDITQKPVRAKRAAPFIYEPYKIIRDGQIQESKKTTTTSNISPLIKQLQSSRVVDKVTKTEKDILKRNGTSTRSYKDIGRNDRVPSKNVEDTEIYDAKFVNVNVDKRRGEPRYELRASNHKPEYTPIVSKKAMSRQDFEAQIKNVDFDKNFKSKTLDIESAAASNNVQRTYATTPSTHYTTKQTTQTTKDVNDDDEEYDYEDDEDDAEEEGQKRKTTITSTTTTSTVKPIFRKKVRTNITTESPTLDHEIRTPIPKLGLVTRFRSTAPLEQRKIHIDTQKKPNSYKNKNDDDDIEIPKYKEKKKTTTKSTLVTDTQKYGDDDNVDGDIEDDMRKKEVDALIGIKHDMMEYVPLYEKEELQKRNKNPQIVSSEEEDNDDDDDENNNNDDDENNNNDDDEDEPDDDDEEEEDNDDSENESLEEDEYKDDKQKIIVTTPEPTKRTLIKTTDTPLSTTEINYHKDDPAIIPIVSKKKIVIHKELPVNKSAPYLSQFKQDIKEVEIVKEIPRKSITKKPKNNSELLELYKDENLATNINKLKDVEVFKQNLDLTTGPKHGGNYKSAKLTELSEETSSVGPLHGGNLKIETKDEVEQIEDDAETSQTEYKKSVELDSPPPRMHGGNFRSINEDRHLKRTDGKNAKLVELGDTTETVPRARHGGNLKSIQETKRRGNKKSERLTELNDDVKDDDDDSSSDSYRGSSRSYSRGNQRGRPMHGGNYRSAKLVQAIEETTPKSSIENTRNRERPSKEAKISAAVLLNSFVQAAPILTTTPAYILDPSKRMYYYVD